jgi:hypothetical protein
VQAFREAPSGVNSRKYSAVDTADPDDLGPVSRKASENATSPSVDSSLDYRRTARWLRDLLKYPEDYTPLLTRIPPRRKRSSLSRGADSPPDTDVITEPPSRSLTTTSTLPPSTVEPNAINRAVNDLEGLLNEALAVACMFADRHDSLSQEALDDGTVRGYRQLPDLSKSKENLSEVALDDSLDLVPRPQPRHSYTFPTPQRPPLAHVMDSFHTIHATSSITGKRDPDPRPSDNQAYNDAICDIEGSSRYVQVPLRNSSMKQRAERQKPAIGPLAPFPHGSYTSSSGGLSADADVINFKTQYQAAQHGTRPDIIINDHSSAVSLQEAPLDRPVHEERLSHQDHNISLRGKSHVSLQGAQAFSLSRSHRRQPIARDWSPARKQFAAIVACVSTAVIGILLGIFAGIVPSIQYYILDTSHLTVYGNVGCFAGMAIPTFLFWPLPLLHGRKPYILTSLTIAMPLLFIQALSVHSQRFHNIAA